MPIKKDYQLLEFVDETEDYISEQLNQLAADGWEVERFNTTAVFHPGDEFPGLGSTVVIHSFLLNRYNSREVIDQVELARWQESRK